MIRRPPISTRTDTLFPDTTHFRSDAAGRLLLVFRDLALEALLAEGERRAPHVGEVVADDEVRRIRAIGVDRHLVHRGLDLVRSEEHTSELQSLMRISYAVFSLYQKICSPHFSISTPTNPF